MEKVLRKLLNDRKYRKWFWVAVKNEACELWEDLSRRDQGYPGFASTRLWLVISLVFIVEDTLTVLSALWLRHWLFIPLELFFMAWWGWIANKYVDFPRRLTSAHNFALAKSIWGGG